MKQWDDTMINGDLLEPSFWNDMVADQEKRAYNAEMQTLPDGDTTPSVAGYRIFKTSNTSPTSYSDFDDAVAGQEIIFLFDDNNSTILSNANIKLQGGADFDGVQYDTIVLVAFTADLWVEVTRSLNS